MIYCEYKHVVHTLFYLLLQKAMVQFAWHDGSTKNIHVDMTQLFEYQKQLKEIVKLYERRVDWLASGSRRIFGTLVEKKWVLEWYVGVDCLLKRRLLEGGLAVLKMVTV